MKPQVLVNEKHRDEIMSLYKIKKQMDVFDRNAIEAMKYDLDIHRPILDCDVAYLRIMQRKYGR